ncbi:MAG: CDP-alcohol phosphatidyltransferase family protein [bacterium]|nr:CDP-alcohol phosphatidyltransferase family protein [bacterium]
MARLPDSKLTERVDQSSVKRSVFVYIIILQVVQICLAILLTRWPGPTRLGVAYIAIALPWVVIVGIVLSRNVHLLYSAQGRVVNKLNLATRVTLIRVICIPLVATLIQAGHFQLAGYVFIGAAVTDWLDGFLARRMGDVTQLGCVADPCIDALFCGITLLVMSWIGIMPFIVLILVLLRYLLLTIGMIWMRVVFGYLPVRATFFGRLFYFFQYVLLVAILLFPDFGGGVWLIRCVGVIQLAVIVQLLALGRSLQREVSHEK